MKDRMDERVAVEAALEITSVNSCEQAREYIVEISKVTWYKLSGLLYSDEYSERAILTDPNYPDHMPSEDYQETLGPVLLNKFIDAVEFGDKMSISLCYREVNALALVTLGRSFEGEWPAKKFWEAVLRGELDRHRMVEQGRSLYPHILECVVSFVEAGGKDPFNLQGVFERLSKLGEPKEGPPAQRASGPEGAVG